MRIFGITFLVACTMAQAALPVVPGAILFENEHVKVVRALEKVHVKGKAHEHKTNRVMVYLQAGQQRFEYQDGRKPQVFNWKAGQVVWSAPDGMHSPEVLSDEPFNIVEVELKAAGAAKPAHLVALDPLTIAPQHYKLEFENEHVRVLRVTVGPHQTVPLHEHARNRVTVYLTDQSFQITTKDGKSESVQHKAGETAWGMAVTHKEENTSDKQFEAVIVELKS